MHIIDIIIMTVYMLTVMGIGVYFWRKNKNADDYYVGGRSMNKFAISLSVVATDVGGGFSIGLGGLGFLMGLSGSWMLFTGLLGAWLSAVFLIPKAGKLSSKLKIYTFPQLFEYFYSPRVALLAGIISAIGYIGFTSSQLLAGAKLASATFEDLDMTTALIGMGAIAVMYTAIGGIEVIRETQPPEFLTLNNIKWYTIVNWAVTIIPIWFVGMTLYQRLYASRTPKEAQKAWYIAGIFEWPIMAFMGVILGLFARVAFENGMFAYIGFSQDQIMDAEMGLPLLLRTILPVGLMGLMIAAYFSAVMSTADSCIMAASGNIESDILKKIRPLPKNKRTRLIQSQLITLGIGVLGLLIALRMENVLELMLHSYAFMVSGLFVPVLGAFFTKRGSATAAFWAMIIGGTTTLSLTLLSVQLPYSLDPNIFGITAAAVCYLILSILFPGRKNVLA
ncbi:MAG TPA: sodium:solute symporter [Porphyromonadaceae bacterium]|jgi:SSS family solute:Na+ symporter|nr:sodium:solute symporter [Porphyromonadaceae bacterium]